MRTKQRYTYMCIKCHHWTEVTSEYDEPKIIAPHRCEACGFSMKEARQTTKLRKVTGLLEEAEKILRSVNLSLKGGVV